MKYVGEMVQSSVNLSTYTLPIYLLHSQSVFTFTKMRVQFRIDNFVNVELRSLSGSIHSTIYVSIHDFIFIQRGRVLVGKRMASSLFCATTPARHYVIRQCSPGLISGLGTK